MSTADPGHAAALAALLDAEAEALLRADFEQLARLIPSKESMIPHAGARSAQQLAALRARIRRNEALLAAVRDGVTVAMARINALQKPGQGVRVYDSAGHARAIGAVGTVPADGGHPRRAASDGAV